MTYEHIDRCCQLHERIEILYVVDGWNVTLLTMDGAYIVFEVKGDNIADAMNKLNQTCEPFALKDIRKILKKPNPYY